MIPMSSPDITDLERQAVAGVLATPILSIGPRLEQFEREIVGYIKVKHAVGVNAGTSGLHLALIAAGIHGGLVITTPFSFIASANCIRYQDAMPIFVDVEEATGNIDPIQIEAAITLHTQAILPVHIFGQPADMDPIVKIARRHGLAVIEDACEALGSEYKGRKAGTLGDVAVFAFYPNKQITTGEGGMVVTNKKQWAATCRSLRNQGRDETWLRHMNIGYNYRLDEMSAALGLAQMWRIDELLAKRERVAGWYNERLEGWELVQRPIITPTTTRMSWFVYVVRILPPANRDGIMNTLAAMGIPSRPYFQPLHLQPVYENYGYRRGQFPVAEYLGNVSLALPFSGVMTEDEVDTVCSALKAVLP